MSDKYEKMIEERIESGREYRRINVANIETRSEEEGEMIVEGYATTFNEPYVLWQDRDGWTLEESVDARAFDDCDMEDVIFQYDHVGRVFARIKNGTLEVEPDEHGLKIRANLGGTEIGRQLFEEIKGGYTDKMSFGFVVDGDEVTDLTECEGVHRTITHIRKLYDVSAVSIPANDATEISARALGEGVIAEAKAERLKAERKQKKIKMLKMAIEMEGEL